MIFLESDDLVTHWLFEIANISIVTGDGWLRFDQVSFGKSGSSGVSPELHNLLQLRERSLRSNFSLLLAEMR